MAMAMAMILFDYDGSVEGIPNVRLVDVTSNHDELVTLLLVRLPQSNHLFVHAIL